MSEITGGPFFPADYSVDIGLQVPVNDEHWHCELFGTGEHGICLYPQKGRVPNWFWRKMQWLILGNKWVYKP